MGALIALPEFIRTYSTGHYHIPNLDSFWYFSDTVHHHQTDFKVEKTFPHTVYIHAAWIGGRAEQGYGYSREEVGRHRIAMREWIEQNIPEPVIYRKIEMDYHRAYPPYTDKNGEKQRGWDRNIAHAYYAFHFQSLGSATLFRLKYAEITTLTTERRHPLYPREEGCIDTESGWAARTIASGYDFDNRASEHEFEF